MSGHFILKLGYSDLTCMLRKEGITLSDIAHAKGAVINPNAAANAPNNVFEGWVASSRLTLKTAMQNGNIPNRANLPPHRYIQIKNWGQLPDITQQYIRVASWVDNLERPTGAGLGLRVLCHPAGLVWGQDKTAALIAQLNQGPVSLEVYYVSGVGVGV